MKDLHDRIWITSKSRMNAEIRYRFYDTAAHIWMSTLSFSLIIASIYSDKLTRFAEDPNRVNVILSISAFFVSLLLYGFRFREKADKYRECYLKLQALYEKRDETPNLGEQYSKILELYPNHSDCDYYDLIVERAIIRKDPVKKPGVDTPIQIGMHAKLAFGARRVIRPVSLYFAPALVIIFSVWFFGGT